MCEAVGISTIVSTSLGKNKTYILVQTILITLLTTFYNYENMTFLLLFEVIFVSFAMAYIFNKKMKVSIFSQVLLAMLINSFCNLSALIVMSMMKVMPIFNLKDSSFVFAQATVLSKVLFLLLAMIIYRNDFKFNDGKLYSIISILLIDVTIIVHGLIDAIIYESINTKMIHLLSGSFILFVILLLGIIYLINKEYENNLKLQRQEAQEKMIKNNLILIESISSKMTDMEHRMNYLLLKLKHHISHNEIDDALALIENNFWKLNRINYYTNTNNPYFDNLFAGVMKKLYEKNIYPIVLCEVKKGELDNNIYITSLFVDFINQLVSLVDKTNQIKITMRSNANSITFSLMIVGVTHALKDRITENEKELNNSNVHYVVNQISDHIIEFRFIYFEVVS